MRSGCTANSLVSLLNQTNSLALGTKLEKSPSVISSGTVSLSAPTARLHKHPSGSHRTCHTVAGSVILFQGSSPVLHLHVKTDNSIHKRIGQRRNMKQHESHRSQMRKHSSGAQQHKAPLKELCFDIHEFSNLAQITWYCIYQTLSNRREGTLCRYLMSRGSSSLFIDLFICLDPFVSNDLLAPSDFHGRTSEQKSCT